MVLAGLGVLAFSFTMPFTRIAIRALDPTFAAVGRSAVASVPAVLALIATRSRRPSAGDLGRLVLVAAGVVAGFPLLSAHALRHTGAGHGAVVVGLLPLAVGGLAIVRAGERPSFAWWGSGAIGLGAVAGYSIHEGGGSLGLADALLAGAVVAAAFGYTEGALLARRLGGWRVICWALVVTAPVTWAVSLAAALTGGGIHASTGQWAAFAYTAGVSMFLGFFAWYAGLARAGLARAGQLQLAQPALSLLWSWPLLGEPLTGAALLTVATVLGAVALGRRSTVLRVPDGTLVPTSPGGLPQSNRGSTLAP